MDKQEYDVIDYRHTVYVEEDQPACHATSTRPPLHHQDLEEGKTTQIHKKQTLNTFHQYRRKNTYTEEEGQYNKKTKERDSE